MYAKSNAYLSLLLRLNISDYIPSPFQKNVVMLDLKNLYLRKENIVNVKIFVNLQTNKCWTQYMGDPVCEENQTFTSVGT